MLLYLTIQKSTRSVDSALIYTEKDSPTFWGAVTLKIESCGLIDLLIDDRFLSTIVQNGTICTEKDSLGGKESAIRLKFVFPMII